MTQQLVKDLFFYNQEEGVLYWRCNRKGHNVSGKPVGYKGSNGYLKTTINQQHIQNHQIIFLYCNGYLPENFIDHIDRDRSNNKIENLREVTHQCNLRNSKLNKNNKSGVKGVFKDGKYNSWIAQLQVDKKTIRVYKGDCFIEAVAHRLAAEQSLNWSGCDSTSPAFLFMGEYVKRT